MTLKLKKQVNTNKPPNALILMPFVGINKIYTQAKLETISGSLASDRLQIKPLIQALNNLNYNIPNSINLICTVHAHDRIVWLQIVYLSKHNFQLSKPINNLCQI